MLRQLVCAAGRLAVLAATAGLLVQPHFGPGHLAAPAAGVLAVLQGISPRRAGRRQRPAAQLPRAVTRISPPAGPLRPLDDQFQGMPAEGMGWTVRPQGRLRGA
jgi:hypothetical protein